MMHALKHPSFFRPASRPTSPSPTPSRPDSGLGFDRVSRPLNKLSLSSFRRPSPSVTPAPAPAPALLVQDGSYLEALSLKLSEAVSKALAQPTGPAGANEQVGGKRPIPSGRGQSLGTLIASELQAARGNHHLHKAILRSLHRPLSVLLSNLSAYLLPLLTSPAFLVPPAPSVQIPNPNPTQLHALALAVFSGELLTSFDEMGLGLDSDVRGDGLRAIREGLASVITRVVNPLIVGIKTELMPIIDALESPVSTTVQKASLIGKSGPVLHPSIVTLQSLMPVYSRALARYTTALPSQASLATFLISIVWRALVALSHRPTVSPSPPASPIGSPAIAPVTLKKRTLSSGTTPPLTPNSARFTMKLPPSRPPSPPTVTVTSTPAADARALYDLLNLLPRPPADTESTRVAREAVDEAFDDLKALVALLESVDNPFFKLNKTEEELYNEVDDLTEDLPTLIALPVMLRGQIFGPGTGASTGPSISLMLKITEDDYRKGCLTGFGRAEECAIIVGNRILNVLQSNSDVHHCVTKWLESRIAAFDH
ncbi:hypothetical protein SERLA73DRAFT_180345 [Serpula lacrymans var. lacrymans S7.3]|uniref:Uncharacterized protein n=2 Tax=Serpula lacrymans var. lacrymans TaxID=341189 RepID=F8PU51_SERL3|nr:uncharacterized protein SERLADRAFT_465921 [Serpula lacrymans var. lacrymans S7.9]EGN99990.1 hypothetical protein SERLA73DRAFT_180345 [Serpula lacrymans var. lacrymans S7.3]EGO25574.1 hypothetical protein SERLADRAFT_465921 [Serpula lacrymans var. lacrymans S7.9]